jgi:hypothetical protein
MPWDLVRDGESLLVELEDLQSEECDALVASVRVQVEDGVEIVNLRYQTMNANDPAVTESLLETIRSEGVDVTVSESSPEAMPSTDADGR